MFPFRPSLFSSFPLFVLPFSSFPFRPSLFVLQPGNSGPQILNHFGQDAVTGAIGDFYTDYADDYPDAASDFFQQHPELSGDFFD